MNPRTLSLAVVLLAGASFWAGCSTPESRIRAQPALFASLAPSDQEKIKSGQVAVGFSQEMVKLALGDPDRIWVRTDASGTNEVWSYTTYESESGVYLYRGYYHRYYHLHDPFYPYFMGVSNRREREQIRVQFADGRVTVVEQEKR